MSYILDALRRAESERERGQVPGLHAQPVPVGLGDGQDVRKGRGLQLAAVSAGVLVLLAGATWWLTRPDPPGPGPSAGDSVEAGSNAARAPASAVAAATTQPPSTGGAAAPAAPAPDGPPLLVAPPAPPEPPAPPPVRARPPVPGPTRSTQAVEAAAPPAPTLPLRPAAAAAPTIAPAAPAAPTVPPTLLLADLPPAQRAELPQMRVGGSIYSDQPSSRFVVINGLVVREGETAAPGVVLERIAPKAAVIRWREMRIEMPL